MVARRDRVALPFCHIQLVGRKPLPPAYPRALKTLGDRLRKRRLDLGLRQCDVAERLNVATTTIYDWETNRTSPQLRFIPQIHGFLGYCPYHTELESLGKRTRTRRRVLGISQKKLAVLLGIDPSTLGRWESGKGKPSEGHQRTLLGWLSGSQLR